MRAGPFLRVRGVARVKTPSRSLVVTCCFTTRRRRQRFYEHEADVAQLCKLCLSPLVTALSARAAVAQALEELALPSVLDR